MEIRVEQVAIPEKIAFNYEELKAWATDIAKSRENIAFTGSKEELAARKKDRSELNSIDKALNDERIRREREYMKPFEAFKAQINEVRAIIKSSSGVIDAQIKEIEEQQKQEKADKIAEYWDSIQVPEWLDLDKIFDVKWLNSSVTMKSITEQIDARIKDIKNDLDTLSNLPEFAFEAIETYKSTLDLNKSIAEGHRLSEMQKRKAEREKAERERLQQEQEQKRKELAAAVTEKEIAESRQNYIEAANTNDVHMQEPVKQWVSFSALLDTQNARDLAEFFKSRNIEFKRI